MSDDDLPVDSYVASKMCDIVESLTHLEHAVTDMRWWLIQGEVAKMTAGIYAGKKYTRELRQHFATLDAAIDDAYIKAAPKPTLVVTTERKGP